VDFHFDDLLDNLLKVWCRLNQGNIKARSDRNRAGRLESGAPKEEFKRPERENILRAIEPGIPFFRTSSAYSRVECSSRKLTGPGARAPAAGPSPPPSTPWHPVYSWRGSAQPPPKRTGKTLQNEGPSGPLFAPPWWELFRPPLTAGHHFGFAAGSAQLSDALG
jgi:hypothetical protein